MFRVVPITNNLLDPSKTIQVQLIFASELRILQNLFSFPTLKKISVAPKTFLIIITKISEITFRLHDKALLSISLRNTRKRIKEKNVFPEPIVKMHDLEMHSRIEKIHKQRENKQTNNHQNSITINQLPHPFDQITSSHHTGGKGHKQISNIKSD